MQQDQYNVEIEVFALTCKFELLCKLRRSSEPLEQSIGEGENPVCQLQLSVHCVFSWSHVPWDWCMKRVVNFIQS